MKKQVLLIAAVAAFALTSCKKEYTCECTITDSTGSETSSIKLDKMKKKDAEKKCDEGDSSFSFFGETITTECKIK
jgi:hypothetical protein